MLRKTAPMFLLLPIALLMALLFTPASTPTEGRTIITPTATPACTTEDGAGMALCYWDARTQGNGMGQSIISGDCALDITGDEWTQSVCINRHSTDGQSGIDAVAECNDIHNRIEAGIAERNKEWSLVNCYSA